MLEDLAWALGVEVIEAPLENLEAFLIRGGNKGKITVNAEAHSKRKRFSIAHELGHWMLHDAIFQFCSTEDFNNYRTSKVEAEANHFAANLLIPAHWIPQEFRKQDPTLKMAVSLSDQLNVSLTAAARRLVEKSPQKLILAGICDGKVKWILRSPEAESSYLWIPPGSLVHPHTATYQCMQDGLKQIEMEEVDAALWIENLEDDQIEECYEEVFNLEGHSTLLTLIWIPC